jgi:ribosome maturation factor RimP
MENDVLINKLKEIIGPIVKELNYDFYYIEYIKESGENYLRIYIDSEKGISLEDCEKVSRKTSAALDEYDPIPDAYYLEVSSPGMERGLYTDEHLQKYIGYDVFIKLSKLFEGKKSFKGKLLQFDMGKIVINFEDLNVSIPRDIISSVNLRAKF